MSLDQLCGHHFDILQFQSSPLPQQPAWVGSASSAQLTISLCLANAFNSLCNRFLISFPWSKKTWLLTHPHSLSEDSQSGLQKSAISHRTQFFRKKKLSFVSDDSLSSLLSHRTALSCMIFKCIQQWLYFQTAPRESDLHFPAAHYIVFFCITALEKKSHSGSLIFQQKPEYLPDSLARRITEWEKRKIFFKQFQLLFWCYAKTMVSHYSLSTV